MSASSDLKVVFDFFDRLDDLKTIDATCDVLQNIIESFGFNSFILTRLAPFSSERFSEMVQLSTLPQVFVEEYTAQEYIRDDQIVHKSVGIDFSFDWRNDELITNSPLEKSLISFRHDIGIHNVSMFPVRGPYGTNACLAVVQSVSDLSKRDRAGLHMIAQYAFAKVSGMVAPDHSKYRKLTNREHEVLTWVASGKSAWEIGEILGISKRTVDEHSQTACHKLGAVNRTQAVAIAVQAHLINI
jgi:LuxR family quorum sensing-dependent transcriptional regulator